MSVVFHSAATIKFDEELKKSIAMNVEAVQSLVKLCKKMKKLEVSRTWNILTAVDLFINLYRFVD